VASPDLEGLIEALTSNLDTIRHYYDSSTGEVVASRRSSEPAARGPRSATRRSTPFGERAVSDHGGLRRDHRNQSLQDELNEALIEMGAFQKFEEVLKKYPTRYAQFQVFRSDKVMARAKSWLREHKLA
jgi:hypothetical protein